MVEGTSLNQMKQDEAKVYRKGETFYEPPGCHHVRCENVGEEGSGDAVFVAVMVVDDAVLEGDGYAGLAVLDVDKLGAEGEGSKA